MADIPTKEPLSFVQGDTVTWKKSLPDYPASDGWILKYYLVNASEQIVIASSADGDDHLVTISATTSSGFGPGLYRYQARAEDDPTTPTEKHTVREIGYIEIKPDLSAQTSGYDYLAHCYKMRDSLQTLLESKAGADNASYAIRDRSLSKYQWESLLETLKYYKREIVRVERKQGLRRSNKIGIQFI
jgi:hypothetical protein